MCKNFRSLVSLVVLLGIPVMGFAAPVCDTRSMAGLSGLMPIILIFAFIYFLFMRPQQKKNKEHQKLLNSLKKDDKIITTGGVYATVSGVNGNIIDVKIADGVYIQVVRQSIATIVTKEGEEAAAKMPEVIKK
ncbi:MAG: preprotein translocase subunit YajC [Endomicrobium sp.]|jgi:preprotein translocase subunit YajC|nr:preprotein translocase subunit YajC [Endomicrobium sp.]